MKNFLSILSIISLFALPVLPFFPEQVLAQSGNLFTNPNFASNNSGWLTGVITPDGWVLAPGNLTGYSTEDFLVMQYEAKAWDTLNDEVVATGGASSNWAGANGQTRYRAISIPEGSPWRYIQQNTTDYDAIDACVDATQLSGLQSGSTHLITNDEWMTLARNIEQQTTNWANGVVGSTVVSGGGLKRGNVGVNDSASYNGADPESGIGRDTKAMHELSNGSQIWDLSGNVWEWTNNTIQRQHQPVAWNGTTEQTGFNYSDYSVVSLARYIQTWKVGGLQQADAGPQDTTLNANHGVGRIYHYSDSADTNTTNYAFLRGGDWTNTASAGVFALLLVYAPSSVFPFLGFRCASDPVEILQSYTPSAGQSGSNANTFNVGNVTQGKIFQEINTGDGGAYELSAIAYNDGNLVDASVASMYAGGNVLDTTYTPLGDGWFKLSAMVIGENSSKEYGLVLEPGEELVLDSLFLGNPEQGIVITANVPEDLTFNISSNVCNLGTLSASSTNTCTHTMSASTNGVNGYSIEYLPTNTLTSTNLDEIDATGALGATANVGTKQFGFNLVENTSPSVGANPSGGVGTVSSNYNTSNIFSFDTSGAIVAASSGPSELTTYTASYIANIDGDTEAGNYSTVVTYVITASY